MRNGMQTAWRITGLMLLLAVAAQFGCSGKDNGASRLPQRSLLTVNATAAESTEAGPLKKERTQNAIHSSRETAITRAVERVSDAVVGINVLSIREYRRSIFDIDPFFRQFFPFEPYRKAVKSLGSGFIIDKEGHVITNEHVVGNAVEITVTLTDGTQHEAELVGSDFISDIALLKIKDPGDLKPVTFGNSDDLLIGEWVIALGNPFGLFEISTKPIVTVGVVSAVDQDFGRVQHRVYKDMIQTDAAINQGNSGGPLVNALGEVIGMNTFIYSGEGGGSIGVGFAIPANRILKIVEELKRYGRVDRSFKTGIEVDDLSPLVARFLGLRSTRGAIITNIERGSAAERAGLRVGDVILKVNGKPIARSRDIFEIIEDMDIRGGDILEFTIYREGKLYTVPVKVEKFNR